MVSARRGVGLSRGRIECQLGSFLGMGAGVEFTHGRAAGFQGPPGGSRKECLEKKMHRVLRIRTSSCLAVTVSGGESLSRLEIFLAYPLFFQDHFLYGLVMGDFPS